MQRSQRVARAIRPLCSAMRSNRRSIKRAAKVCCPDGVAAAAALGIDLHDVESHPIRGIRFHGEGVSVAADFPDEPGRGIRRTTLHRALLCEAERCGVELRWGSSVSARDRMDAKWLIGADGIGSGVRKWAGLDAYARDSRRYGFRAHYRLPPWTEYVEVYWAEELPNLHHPGCTG